MGIVAEGQDRAIEVHLDDTALATGAGIAADSHADRSECTDGTGNRIAAITATAADRLADNPGRAMPAGFDECAVGAVDPHGATAAANRTVTANSDAGEEATGHGAAAIAAATADGLRDNAV